jgi:hypothetical protein
MLTVIVDDKGNPIERTRTLPCTCDSAILNAIVKEFVDALPAIGDVSLRSR